MCIENEVKVYENVQVSYITGEIASYEETFFVNVIRRREIDLIDQVLRTEKPRLVLDYGCGPGWLSRLMYNWGFDVVGVDISKKMVKAAKFVSLNGEFVVCDGMRLPFRRGVFDFIVGISILHHLPDLNLALRELRRVSIPKTVFLFMEPNSLNPISAFGRRLFPTEAHTKGEKPFTFGYLKEVLNMGSFKVEKYFTMFFFSFPVARLLKIVKMKPSSWLIKIFERLKEILEKVPCFKYLNSMIVVLARRDPNT